MPKNRVILASSALQIIIAKSALDFLNDNETYSNHVIAFHPALNECAIEIMQKYCQKFKFESFLNLSEYSREFENKKIEKFHKNNLFLKLKNINNYANFYSRESSVFTKKISEIIKDEIGVINSVIVRSNYKKIDTLYIDAANYKDDIIQIEEGIVDYAKRYWEYTSFNFYEIRSLWMQKIYNLIFFFFMFIKFNYVVAKKLSFIPKYNFKIKFNYFNYKQIFDKYFLKNISKINTPYDLSNFKVIIIGTTLKESQKKNKKFEINEINFYNKLIHKICKKHKIKESEVLYKPHPRDTNFDQKKLNLNCEVIDNIHNILSEDLLYNNKSIKYLYTINSSSALYASRLYKMNSNIIYLDKILHKPTTYRFITERFCKQNNINTVKNIL